MNPLGEVVEVNSKKGYFVVKFLCADPPFPKRQPCYEDVIFDLNQVEYVHVGMLYQIKLRAENNDTGNTGN